MSEHTIHNNDNSFIEYINIFASHPRLYKTIDQEYQKHKYEAYALAKNSKYYNHIYIKNKSIEFCRYARRILGLLLIDQDYYMNLFIQTNWRKIYNFFEKNKRLDDIDIIEKLRKIIYIESDPPFATNTKHLLSFYYIEKMPDTDFKKHFIKNMTPIVDRSNRLNISQVIKNNIQTNKNEISNVWRKFKELHNITYPVKQMTKYMMHFYNDNEPSAIDLDYFSHIADYMLIDDMFLTKYLIKQQDIDFIIEMYLESLREDEKPNYRTLQTILNLGLYEIALLDEYQKTKDYFFENNQETTFTEIQTYKNAISKLKTENKQLKHIKNEIQAQLKKTQTSLNVHQKKHKTQQNDTIKQLKKHYMNIISDLKNENKQLQQQQQHNQYEIDELSHLIFPTKLINTDEDINDEEITIEEAIAIINQYKHICYMSSPDFAANKIKILKEKLPILDFYADKQIIPDHAFVFIDWQQLCHRDYYKNIDRIRNKNKKYHFIQASGVNETIKEIANILINKN